MSADKYPSMFSRQMEATVYRIYYDGGANENSRISLFIDPVFSNSLILS